MLVSSPLSLAGEVCERVRITPKIVIFWIKFDQILIEIPYAGGPQPSVLQEVSIPVWSNPECRLKYGAAAPGGIVEHMLCAGKASMDSCSVSIILIVFDTKDASKCRWLAGLHTLR